MGTDFINKIKENSQYRLLIILGLISIHSFVVGIGLIFLSGEFMEYIGFQFVHERFFQAQAGVFHVIFSICYILPALEYKKFKSLVIFSIMVKLCATVFLFIYFLLVDPVFIVLLSGFGDGAMAVLIFYAYRSTIKSDKYKDE